MSLRKSPVIYLENGPSPEAGKEADLVRQYTQWVLMTHGAYRRNCPCLSDYLRKCYGSGLGKLMVLITSLPDFQSLVERVVAWELAAKRLTADLHRYNVSAVLALAFLFYRFLKGTPRQTVIADFDASALVEFDCRRNASFTHAGPQPSLKTQWFCAHQAENKNFRWPVENYPREKSIYMTGPQAI
jgi:hypothetical protein